MLTLLKVGQSQLSIMLLTNFVGPESPMLYTKFQGHRPAGKFRRRTFLKDF